MRSSTGPCTLLVLAACLMMQPDNVVAQTSQADFADCTLSPDSFLTLKMWADGSLNMRKQLARMEVTCAASGLGKVAGQAVGGLAGAWFGFSSAGWMVDKLCSEVDSLGGRHDWGGVPSVACTLYSFYARTSGLVVGSFLGADAGRMAGDIMATNFVETFLTIQSFLDAVEECVAFMDLSDDYSRLTEEMLKKRFRKLSLKHHPDHGGSQEMFVKLVTCEGIIKAQKGWGMTGKDDL
jgi:hypothetical protein